MGRTRKGEDGEKNGDKKLNRAVGREPIGNLTIGQHRVQLLLWLSLRFGLGNGLALVIWLQHFTRLLDLARPWPWKGVVVSLWLCLGFDFGFGFCFGFVLVFASLSAGFCFGFALARLPLWLRFGLAFA